MTALGEVTQIILAAIGSSGIILFAGKFFVDKIVGKRVDLYFNERLAGTQAYYAERLAELTADLKKRADSKLEEERSNYSASLESLKAALLKEVNKDLEGIRSSYVMQQEIRKAQLTVQAQDSLEIYKIRRDKYPPLDGLIYRIRNTARETLKNPASPADGLKDLVTQLEEKMFELKTYLDSDSLHFRVHSFKGLALAIANRLTDGAAFLDQNKLAEAEEARNAAVSLYPKLDELYAQLSDAFKVLIAASHQAAS